MKKNITLIIAFVLAIALAVTAFFLGIKIGEDSGKNTTESSENETANNVAAKNDNNSTAEYTYTESVPAEQIKTEPVSEKFNEAIARKLINQYINVCESENVNSFVSLFCPYCPQLYLDEESTDLGSYMEYSLSKEYTITYVNPIEQDTLDEINQCYKKYGFSDIFITEGYEVEIKENENYGRTFGFVKENGSWKIAFLGFWG